MRAWIRDFGLAVRVLRKNFGFTIVAVVTLGLGIGANTAIFTIFDQVLLRALPIREPDRLVLFDQPGMNCCVFWGPRAFSYPMYRELRDKNEVFDGVLGRFPTPLNLSVHGSTERVEGVLVSGNYFSVLGVEPVAGRLLTPQDDVTPGAHRVAVLSHDYWRRRFGGDLAVVGQDLRINNEPMTIVGVTRPGFRGVDVGSSPDIFVPLTMKRAMTPTWNGLDEDRVLWLNVLARLRPGYSAEKAAAGANVLYHQILERELQAMPPLSERFRDGFLNKKLLLSSAETGASSLRDQFATPLKVLLGMVGLVLLIACANVSNLLIARSAARQRDTAIRLALGATRWEILRQHFAETWLLALAGAGAGVLLANLTAEALLRTLPFASAARSFSASPDLRVLGFASLLAVATALAASLAPALRAFRFQVVGALKTEASNTTGAVSQVRLRKGMVAVQVAISLVLLIGAGLFARSLANLKGVDPGFRINNVLLFSIDPALAGYDQDQTRRLVQQIQEGLVQIPGVVSASVAEVPLLADQVWNSTVTIEGYEPKEGEDMNPGFNAVGPDYFRTLGIPLMMGREFTAADEHGAPKVAIINQAMAEYFFGDESPLGRMIGTGAEKPNIEIVGVVGNGRFQNLQTEADRHFYLPYYQVNDVSEGTLYLRGSLDPAVLSVEVRQLMERIDPNLPLYNLKTLQVQLRDSLFLQRMVSSLSIAFGGLATILAAIGLYGVMAFAVVRRKREIGIRMALGADRLRVVRLVLRESLRVTLAGLGIGLLCGVVAARLLESQLFGLSPSDPVSISAAALVLMAVALFAGYIPARRASRVEPSLALRSE